MAPRPPIHHPIPKLVADAREKFETKVKNQSKTLKEAVREYRRRYNRDPPKGFDKWWEFAKQNNAILVDEYDQIYRDLQPFYELSGQEVRRRCRDISHDLPSIDLVRIENGTAKAIAIAHGFRDSEGGARGRGFVAMVQKFVKDLPDMEFPINEKAEGRVLVPWEEKKFSNLTKDTSSAYWLCEVR